MTPIAHTLQQLARPSFMPNSHSHMSKSGASAAHNAMHDLQLMRIAQRKEQILAGLRRHPDGLSVRDLFDIELGGGRGFQFYRDLMREMTEDGELICIPPPRLGPGRLPCIYKIAPRTQA